MDQPLESLGSTRSTRRASYQHSWPTLHLPCSGQHLLQSQAEQQASLCQLPRVPIRSSGRGLTGELFSPCALQVGCEKEGSFGQRPAPPAVSLTRSPTDKCPCVKLVGFPICKLTLQWNGHCQPLGVQVLTWDLMLRTEGLRCAGGPHLQLCGVLLCTGLLQDLFCLSSPARESGFSTRHAESFVCPRVWLSFLNGSWTRWSL